jgi:predicted nuclease with TOPRIM domain
MNDDTHIVNWRSVAQDLVSTHRIFERESKIIVSKLLLEKSEFKTRFEENLKQTLDYKEKIHDLEENITSLLDNNISFQEQRDGGCDRIKDLETQKSDLSREHKETLAERDYLSSILSNITNVVDIYRQKPNFTPIESHSTNEVTVNLTKI